MKNLLKNLAPHIIPSAGLIFSTLALHQKKKDSAHSKDYYLAQIDYWEANKKRFKSGADIHNKDASTNSASNSTALMGNYPSNSTAQTGNPVSTPMAQTGNPASTPSSSQNVPINSGSDSTEIKSSSFDFLKDLLDLFQDFLSTLALDQTLALINLFIIFIVSLCLFNIFIILASDYLIESFKLEARYPKLTTFLIFRKTINKGYLYLNTIFLTLILLYGFVINTLIVFNLI
jgi:hypothetical protein